jgi:hypothetical protein
LPFKCDLQRYSTVRTSAGVLVSADKGKTWKAIGSWRARGIRWLIEGTVVGLCRLNQVDP